MPYGRPALPLKTGSLDRAGSRWFQPPIEALLQSAPWLTGRPGGGKLGSYRYGVSIMPALESIERALGARGYRLTPARRAVLHAILRHPDHFSAEEVMRQTSAGRATVFRTVRLLYELGILCRVLLEDGRLHYRLSDRRRHHHHLVCVGCGRVQDLEECTVTGLVRELSRSTGYQIQGHWLEFYGRCLSCRHSEETGGDR